MIDGTIGIDAGQLASLEAQLEAASTELLRRQRARTSLVEFARSIEIPGVPSKLASTEEDELYDPIETVVADVHRIIMEEIQRCMETPGGRLMILAPPGSAKSTYAAVVAPTWAMGRWPGHKIILGSYASEIAVKQSRKARALCRQPRYTAIFPERPQLATDQKAADDWRLDNGSEYMAAGLLAGITGNRANGLIIDDPVQNREAADSATVQEKTYSEYTDTGLTRLLPNGYAVIIQTRWNQNDLAGRILPEDYDGQSGDIMCQDGQVWRVLCLPAQCDREDDPLGRVVGDYLWPEWFPETHWLKWKNNKRARRTWASLFQQRPTPDEGIQFTRSMFKRFDPKLPAGHPGGPPSIVRKYGASDYATKDEDAAGPKDYTEHAVAGMDRHGDLFFLDWWQGQRETDKSITAFVRLLLHRPLRWANEGGPIDLAIRPAINRAMREANRYTTIVKLTSIQDKSIKLTSFHARCSAGTVWVPYCEWGEALIDQLIKFPAGKFDDKCDVAGLLGRLIDTMNEPSMPQDAPTPDLKPFSAKWLEYDESKQQPAVRYTSG